MTKTDNGILPSTGQSAPLRSFYQDEAFYAGLDPGIRFAVRILHAHGIETCQSCEAGPGHCYPEPSIDLMAGGDDALGFAALHYLNDYGLAVAAVALVWNVRHALPYEKLWRITFVRACPERADERPLFIWGYRAQGHAPAPVADAPHDGKAEE